MENLQAVNNLFDFYFDKSENILSFAVPFINS